MFNVEKKRLFVFDFDGVLADSVDVKTRAFVSLFEHASDEVITRIRNHHLEHGGMNRFDKFSVYHQYLYGEPATEKQLMDYGRRFSQLVVDAVVSSQAIAGSESVLEYCSSHAITAIVNSGTPEDELQQIVTRRGWGDYFARVLGSPASKEENLALALKQGACQAEQAVMFGDSGSDLNAALSLDVDFVAINAHQTLASRAEEFPRFADFTEFLGAIG